MPCIINGIQQIGIGVSDAKTVFNWYRKYLGFDILVFEDIATASLMTRYTADRPEERYAMLALNMGGGGGLEIWQYNSRIPQPPSNTVRLGDLGINAMKVRSHDIKAAHACLKALLLKHITPVFNGAHFFFKDPWDNWIQVVADNYSFSKSKCSSGGVVGALIGVSDMDASLFFYENLLGYNQLVSDDTGSFEDLVGLPGGKLYRRVLLKHDTRATGGFGQLYGPSQIELFQALDRTPNTIYKDRLWGDLGFIHLCFDVHGMDAMRKLAESMDRPFTVDSADSFDMGEAAGRFGYLEDPDGTLIELVETHKVPILKKLGISIDLKGRNPQKPLPKWLVGAMRIHRVNSDL